MLGKYKGMAGFALLMLAFLPVLLMAGVSGAEVMLKPRVSAGGMIAGGEDHVYFGRYPHLNGYTNGNWWEGNEYESSERPILWRVMKTGAGAATLFSHYILETNHYHESNEGNDWKDSQMRQFLNSDENEFQTYELGYEALDPKVPGFLHTSRFSYAERAAMLSSPDGIEGSVVTLASKEDVNGGWFVYTSAENLSRQAGTITESLGSESYWLRTPSGAQRDKAWNVDHNGGASEYQAFNPLGVRPAFSLNLGAVLFKASSSDVYGTGETAAGGSFANPFILFMPGVSPYNLAGYSSDDISPSGASINGCTLALTFDRNISPAVRSWPAAGDFTLRRSGGQAMAATAVRSSSTKGLVLIFPAAVAAGETVSLDYTLNHDAVSFDMVSIAKVMASQADIAVVNTTQSDGGGDGDPNTQPSAVTTPGKIIAMVSGTTYEAEKQTDGTYLIVLPYGTDLTNIPVIITPPKGGSVSPDLSLGADFSHGPVTFTVTAADGKTTKEYTLEIGAESDPGTSIGGIVGTDVSRWSANVTYNAGGSLRASLHLPLSSALASPSLGNLNKLHAVVTNLTGISFAHVDGSGNVVPLPRAAAAAEPYLRIDGTAADKAVLESATLSRISYWLKNDATEYRQDFSPPIRLGDLSITYTNEPPTQPEEPGSSGSSGCDMGFRAFALLALARVLVSRKSR